MVIYPKDWKIKKISSLGTNFSGLTGKKADDFGEGNSFYITFLNVLNNTKVDFTILEKVKISSYENQNEIQLGDLLFNTSSETPEEVGMCAAVTKDVKNVYLNSFCFGFRLHNNDEILPLYASYLFNSSFGRDLMFFAAQGSTRYNLSKRYFSQIELTLPSISEQDEIVSVLSDIDDHIFNLKKLIEKKRAMKEGILSDFMNTNSRIDAYIDEWEETNINDITKSIISGGTPSTLIREYWDGDIPWLASTEVHQKIVKIPTKNITEYGLLNSAAKIAPENSVLIALAGQGKTRGTAAYLSKPMAINQSLAALVTSDNIDAKFLYYLMESKYTELRELSSGDGGRGGLNKSLLKKFEVVLPKSKKEQEVISHALTLIDLELNNLIKEKEKIIQIKDGVIDDLLSGRIRLTI